MKLKELSSISYDKRITEDTLLYLFSAYSDLSFSKTMIQKIVYKVREEAKLSHEKIPYFWYLHGPFSIPVANTVDNFFNDGIIDLKDNFFQLKDTSKTPKEVKDINPEIKDAIHSTMEYIFEHGFSKYAEDSLLISIYKNDAPYRFQLYFGIHFRKTTEILDKLGYLYRSRKYLPKNEELFTKFNDLFYLFSSVAEEHLEEGEEIPSLIIEETWSTFVNGLRLRYHDKPYEIFTDLWKEKYISSLHKYEETITAWECEWTNIHNFKINNEENIEIKNLIKSYLEMSMQE